MRIRYILMGSSLYFIHLSFNCVTSNRNKRNRLSFDFQVERKVLKMDLKTRAEKPTKHSQSDVATDAGSQRGLSLAGDQPGHRGGRGNGLGHGKWPRYFPDFQGEIMAALPPRLGADFSVGPQPLDFGGFWGYLSKVN
jgi:hypothetical protein